MAFFSNIFRRPNIQNPLPIPPTNSVHLNIPQKESKFDYTLSMKIMLKSILDVLDQKGEDIKIFKDNIKNPKFVKGENFEGTINENKQIIGIALYYQQKKDYDNVKDEQKEDQKLYYRDFSVFFGECKKGKRIGKGIEVVSRVLQQNIKAKKQAYITDIAEYIETILLENWDQNITEQQGFYYEKKEDIETTFKGKFHNLKFNEGIYKIFNEERPKIMYKGCFKKSKFDGIGQITVFGKHRYIGTFYENKRQGEGEQQDFVNKTIYLGEFDNDKKNGYGQLTFLNKDKMKLKGFWVNDFVQSHEGVYVSHLGEPIEVFNDDIQ